MIFASDLDRTLIYSRQAFGPGETDSLRPVRLIESKQEQEISFMTEKAVTELKELADRIQFVPVTTRTLEQYQRISLFREEIKPLYAITSNGGHVLVDGRIDEEWQWIMKQRLEDSCMCMEEIVGRFEKDLMHPNWVFSSRSADGLFYYCIIERELAPLFELQQFQQWLGTCGWLLYSHGRKLYVIPEAVNKRDAVDFVKMRSGAMRVAAAGDSVLDLDMLHQADVGISPLHGEIYQLGLGVRGSSSIIFTEQQGIRAAEDILRSVNAFTGHGTTQAGF
ncbi:HAD family hydrolase [Aneurinibacillus sp. Ricciae_BoGa-3]|uniref:HAD family hydrolase n=1 Tax=Aneurinibacillus sp. Ricciae_BoGa-3 TaxID=3022697 RepID=UPI0023426024|nr:HAD family hydrolase [Aneurinibacillus sp. Ricciae_BoGa-3]WCK55583.1 HAD family hydrolase [Aneurinibacillus sp. Ricciae_BoGa-3]